MSNPLSSLPESLAAFTVVAGSDHAGFALKQALLSHLQAAGIAVQDVGCYDDTAVDYPGVAARAAEVLHQMGPDGAAMGLLCCGSGVGMGIAANRFAGLRAVVANDVTTARLSRQHNNANVLCLGARITALPLAQEILDVFLATAFDENRHAARVAQLDALCPLS